MAAYISFQPSDFFNTILYTGNGSTQSLTGVGFQPDMNWVKNRDTADNNEICSPLIGVEKYISPDGSSSYGSDANALTSFDADGVSIGSWGTYNGSGNDLVMWNWKAGTTSGISGGTITPSSYSINTTSGLGMYKFTGTGSNGTIAHGLGTTPKMIWVKRYDGTANWQVQHTSLAADKVLYLNTTHGQQTEAAMFNSTQPTSSVFSLGTASETNGSGNEYLAFAFAPIRGYSSIGHYIGNGSVNGPYVHCGFQPAMVIVKNGSSGGVAGYGWGMFDNKRSTSGGTNEIDYVLHPDAAVVEDTGDSSWDIDFLSNGFKIREDNSGINNNNDTFVYYAVARFPIVSSNDVAVTARQIIWLRHK